MDNAVRFLQTQDDFTLIAHISPDGDTLGSSLALFHALLRMGKRAQVVCADEVPAAYRFCPHADEVQKPDLARQTGAVVTVDCADKRRLGACAALFDGAAHTLNIDHHGTNDAFAEVNWVEPVGATGELVYRLLSRLPVEIDVEAASLLYVALTTDTGNFSYSNASPQTFRIAAELLERGIDLPELNRRLFRTVPYRKRLLEARTVARCALHAGGRIAVSTLSLENFAACGATGADAEGLIDLLRDIDTVEIAALLREQKSGTVQVSLRGKRVANVSRIASRFGGGGHWFAAGCVLPGPLEAAAAAVLAAAREALPAEEAR